MIVYDGDDLAHMDNAADGLERRHAALLRQLDEPWTSSTWILEQDVVIIIDVIMVIIPR